MEKHKSSILPQDFLNDPAPKITASRIDFSKTPLPEYKGLYTLILDNVLTPNECETLVHAVEATTPNGWERAAVNIGLGEQMVLTDQRNCGRIIWDSRELVAKIWKRIENVPEVQAIVRLEKVPHIFGHWSQAKGEVWKFTRPNERMRFLKYVGGEYFRPHCDGVYETPDRKERSYFTLHLYLNNADEVLMPDKMEDSNDCRMEKENVLVGGATTFHSYDMKRKYDVLPKAGRILLFQHRDLLHSGDDVLRGVKYTMRTDLMYTLESSKSTEQRKTPLWDSEDEPMDDLEEGTDGAAEAQWYNLISEAFVSSSIAAREV